MPSNPQQSGKLKSQHGAWSILCDTPAGAKTEQCALIQNVVAAKRPELGLSVVVLKTADNKARILRVLAPLGVLLPNGLGLNVDGKDIGRAYFVRCFEDGCYAEVILEDDLLKTLRSGKAATFIVFQTPEEGVGIPVDLKGFGEGFDALPDSRSSGLQMALSCASGAHVLLSILRSGSRKSPFSARYIVNRAAPIPHAVVLNRFKAYILQQTHAAGFVL